MKQSFHKRNSGSITVKSRHDPMSVVANWGVKIILISDKDASLSMKLTDVQVVHHYSCHTGDKNYNVIVNPAKKYHGI